MHKKLITLLLFISLGAKGDYWTQKASFPGGTRALPFSFSIGNKGYVGCGVDSNQVLHNDFWEYEPAINSWTQKANFGGVARTGAMSFVIGNKGYAGTGIDSASLALQDFWEYDALLNNWTQKANFGGGNRFAAVGFAIGNMGYAGTGAPTGFGNGTNDIWQYNPSINNWVQKSGLPVSNERWCASSFTIGIYGYITSGYSTVGSQYALWEYNSVTDIWTQKANFPGLFKMFGIAFTICDKGYLGLGHDIAINYDMWEYNPATNLWTQKANASTDRYQAAYFSIGSKGYVGLGRYTLSPWNYHDDFWEYTPDSACTTGLEELPISNFNFQLSPNPCKEFLVCSFPFAVQKNTTLTVTDAQGKTIFTTLITTASCQLPTSKLPSGIYTLRVDDGKQSAVKKFVKE